MKKILSFIFIFSLFTLFSGCANKQFNDAFASYKALFVSSMEFIANSTQSTKALVVDLKSVDIETLEENIKKLKAQAAIMKSSAKSDHEKYQAEYVETLCNDMDFLLDARKRIDNLTEEDVWDLSIIYNGFSARWDEFSGKPRKEYVDEEQNPNVDAPVY